MGIVKLYIFFGIYGYKLFWQLRKTSLWFYKKTSGKRFANQHVNNDNSRGTRVVELDFIEGSCCNKVWHLMPTYANQQMRGRASFQSTSWRTKSQKHAKTCLPDIEGHSLAIPWTPDFESKKKQSTNESCINFCNWRNSGSFCVLGLCGNIGSGCPVLPFVLAGAKTWFQRKVMFKFKHDV